MRSNFGDALRYAAILGHGISMHQTYMVADDLASKTLVEVLPGYEPTGLDICAVFPSRRNLPLRVTTFLAFLKAWFRTPPDWAAPRFHATGAVLPTPARARHRRNKAGR
jgi:DNA-binding transcriptional LysR family regulator